MKTIECYRLESIAESGMNALVARFASRAEAEAAKDLAAGYGPKITHEVITIFDTAVEFEPRLNKAAAASGLAKLTPAEKAALGLE